MIISRASWLEWWESGRLQSISSIYEKKFQCKIFISLFLLTYFFSQRIIPKYRGPIWMMGERPVAKCVLVFVRICFLCKIMRSLSLLIYFLVKRIISKHHGMNGREWPVAKWQKVAADEMRTAGAGFAPWFSFTFATSLSHLLEKMMITSEL